MKRINIWLKKRSRLLLGLSSTVVMIIILFFLMDIVVMPLYTRRGREVELPDITMRPFSEAKEILNSHGFKIVKKREIYDAIYPESTVINQNPLPYIRVKRGRKVYVTISAGEQRVRVPRVISKSEREAEFILNQAGLQLGKVDYQHDSYYLKDVVCGQSILPDEEVTKGTSVDIVVSLGPKPDYYVVPDLIGKSLTSAKMIIQQAGFKVGKVSYIREKRLVPDTVIRQSLSPGERVDQSQEIDLVVSRIGDVP